MVSRAAPCSRRAASPSPIELSGVVEKARYCAGSDDLAILQLHLQLTYRNVSAQPVIVYRTPLLTEVSVGGSQVNGRVNELEFQFERTVAIGGRARMNDSWPNRAFVLLQSGETFASQETVAVPIALKPGVPAAAGIGQHFLESPAVIWPYSSEVAEHLRGAWSRIGRLWTTPVLTKPIPFKVESAPHFEACG